MPPKAGFMKGKENLDKNFEKMTASSSGVEILEYQFDFHEVIVCGEYAFEYGAITGKSKEKSSEEVTSSSYKMMRILRKEGSNWKVFRTIWNDLK
jgi:ketosteroid isomerase-like protein